MKQKCLSLSDENSTQMFTKLFVPVLGLGEKSQLWEPAGKSIPTHALSRTQENH